MLFRRPKPYADGDRIEVAGAAVVLRVSGRARRIGLRLDTARGEIIAVAPSPRRLGEAAAFAAERAAWIVQRLAELPPAEALAPGAMISVLGQPCRVEYASSGRPRWRAAAEDEPRRLIASGDEAGFARSVLRALKAEARQVLEQRTRIHARALGQPAPAVAIMDARARWGSCKPPRKAGFGAAVEVGRIRYSWRLVLAPFEVMDYVAAHECAHLIEANHSARFWAVVRELIGDVHPHRVWLRANGPRLHAFGRG